MFAKIEVNGDGAADVSKFLKAGNPDEEGKEDIAWNFTKFLVGRDGSVIARFAPKTTPEDIGKLAPYFERANSRTSSFVPGSWAPNWLQGKASTWKPLAALSS